MKQENQATASAVSNAEAWADAPKEAEWLAMDKDGTWNWFEFWPTLGNDKWLYRGGGFYRPVGKSIEYKGSWLNSLRGRGE
jgi:hypothetical protein